MNKYSFYSKSDSKKEYIGCGWFGSRFQAAEHFANRKKLTLKEFLKLYSISR